MDQKFSRLTVIAAIDVLQSRLSQAETTALILELGPGVDRHVRGDEVSCAKRMNDLKRFMQENRGYITEDGPLETILVERACLVVSHCIGIAGYDLTRPDELDQILKTLLRRLAQDGFTIERGVLRKILPDDVHLPEAESFLVSLLTRHGFDTASGHLDQAIDAHTRGKWSSSNGQIRNFLDSVIDTIAERIDPSVSSLSSGQPRRTKLASLGFLSKSLNEWDDDGKGYINGLVKRLHPEGSHPGLSDEEDSTFRLHVVILTATLLMRRFDRMKP